MIDVLINPDKFFRERTGKESSLKIPLIIVLLIGVIGAASSTLILSRIMPALPPEAAQASSFIIIFGVISALVVVFIIWAIYSGVFYLISMAFKGEGKFKRVLEFVGYGFIPSILGGIIALLLMWYALPGIQISLDDPQMLQETLTKSPIMKLSTLVSIIFTLWSANIWIFALKYARNLSLKNAAITVLVPLIIYIGWTAYSLIR